MMHLQNAESCRNIACLEMQIIKTCLHFRIFRFHSGYIGISIESVNIAYHLIAPVPFTPPLHHFMQ